MCGKRNIDINEIMLIFSEEIERLEVINSDYFINLIANIADRGDEESQVMLNLLIEKLNSLSENLFLLSDVLENNIDLKGNSNMEH